MRRPWQSVEGNTIRSSICTQSVVVLRSSRPCEPAVLTSCTTTTHSGAHHRHTFPRQPWAPRREVLCKAANSSNRAADNNSVRPRNKSIGMQQQLSSKDRQLVRLYIAGCFRAWDQLPDIAREFLTTGCTAEELRGCIRHLVVFAGYAPCLAATLTLQKANLLPEDTPAKCGGMPGNAFELVYGDVVDKVRSKLHSADPVLGEWIRTSCYGEVYSSPGLDLRQKQLLACAFLGVAHMPDQLFGHALAGLRFGASKGELEEAVLLGFHQEVAVAGSERARDEALEVLDKAYVKYMKDYADQHSPPDITIPDPSSIRIPPLPPLYNTSSVKSSEDATVA